MDQEESFFHIKDCTLIEMATGQKSFTLNELRDKLSLISFSSIYYHFWGKRLSYQIAGREYFNDFALWADHSLHDPILAERLAIVDPTEFATLDLLRAELIELIEERMDEREIISWAKPSEPFRFMSSKLIIFSTTHYLHAPAELVTTLPKLTESSIFYHFIDARRRTEESFNDFSVWLQGISESYRPLAEAMAKVDPYFISLCELQKKLTFLATHFFSEKDGS